MSALITRRRLALLTGFASTQLAVQLVGFAAGIVLVRAMAPVEYGYYTLALSMLSIANIVGDLGLATAVMSIGGRLTGQGAGQRAALGQLVGDANALQRRLARWSVAALVPCFALMLLRQHAPVWQVAALTGVILAASALTVRNGIALSIARLLGHVGLQQRLDVALNLGRLTLLLLAAWLTLDATVACLVNLGVAIAGFVVLRRHMRAQLDLPSSPVGEHAAALRGQLRQLAPNAVFYVLSNQVTVWLIGVFGSAERVAEVGALSRLGALFTVIGAVTAALVLPYFARRDGPAEIAAGFGGVNAFFAALLAVLVASAIAFPATILWVLGGNYDELHAELGWMVAGATLWVWGGTVYSIGCARGWVAPVSLMASTGVLATAAAAALVDVASVRGVFIVSAATALAGLLASLGYVGWQLRRHARLNLVTAP